MADAATAGSRRIVFVTQLFDVNDPVLGFVERYVRGLLGTYDEVVVIANEVREVPPGLAADVHSMGKEDGASRGGRAARYLGLLADHVRPGDVVLAHMCPVYAVLAAPLARLRRAPLLLWYAHPSVTPVLRLAHSLVDGVLTSLPAAYPLRDPKVQTIGQATDVRRLRLAPLPSRGPLSVVALGRTSPSKGFVEIIQAVQCCLERGVDVRLRIVGPSTTPEERDHRRLLESLIHDADVDGRIGLDGPVAPQDVAGVLAVSHLLVNNMIAGSGDKVVFEAMARGRAVLVSNPSFHALLADMDPPATFRQGDTTGLVEAIEAFARLDNSALSDLGRELRRRVVRDHSVDHWAAEVLRVGDEVRTRVGS